MRPSGRGRAILPLCSAHKNFKQRTCNCLALVLGVAQSASGQPGMTANLTVDYRSPTPLLHELVFRGWCEKVEGRKIFTRGTLHSGDTLCAESSALFISMRPELFARLLALRDGQS